ncbi:hypothetical protein [Leptospira interrogans]|uniref:hypothetical protein n=1 Tax=Leptospira interrogans TaxID=173 RepID=UPI000773EE4D|nr:hypothetical protein [Leptospira interrogans]
MNTKKTILIEFTPSGVDANGIIEVKTTGWHITEPGIVIAAEQLSMCDYMQKKILSTLLKYTTSLEKALSINGTSPRN